MNQKSKTDWGRIKREAVENAPVGFDPASDPYDPNDAKAVEAYWSGATVKRNGVVTGRVRGLGVRPAKERITIRLSPDVVQSFRATGDGWQTRVDAALRDWLKTHSAA